MQYVYFFQTVSGKLVSLSMACFLFVCMPGDLL